MVQMWGWDMRRADQRAVHGFWLGALAAAFLVAVFAETRAQPAPGEDAAVLAVDRALGDAMRAGDKSIARRLLSLQFTYTDEDGKHHERKEFLADLKGVAAAPATDVKVAIYGLVAAVTGNRKSAQGSDVFFLDIWARQKGAWRVLTMQDVVPAAEGAPQSPSVATGAPDKPYDCKNPCQTIPYRVRSPAEQEVINSFQAMEKASAAGEADEWRKHGADEFVLYRSDRAPIPKSDGLAVIARAKKDNANVRLSEIETMRLSVYGDGAAMTATRIAADNSRPPFRSASVWVKRNGQWQLAIDVQTDTKAPPQQ
jgi:Domain of unknown function (DUF4440)